MRCPVCVTVALELMPDSAPPVHRCGTCDGRWLPFEAHQAWVESGTAEAGTGTADEPAAELPAEPARKPRLCPRCGRLLTRYRISPDLPFQLDRCGLCAGVWFDSGEWAAVTSRGMLPRLQHLFNDTTQRRLAQELLQRQHEQRCRAIVGDEAFERVRAFKAWMEGHPQRATLRAYLDGDDEDR